MIQQVKVRIDIPSTMSDQGSPSLRERFDSCPVAQAQQAEIFNDPKFDGLINEHIEHQISTLGLDELNPSTIDEIFSQIFSHLRLGITRIISQNFSNL